MRQIIDASIDRVNRALQEYGHKSLPLNLYHFYKSNKTDTYFPKMKCQKNETNPDCDERVDLFNILRWVYKISTSYLFNV